MIYQQGERIDHYQIIRRLGAGVASHVYLAQDWHAQQEVVLKFPRDEVVGGMAVFRRYQREAEIGQRLSHPYLQQHLNCGEQRSKDYLVLPNGAVKLLDFGIALLEGERRSVRRLLSSPIGTPDYMAPERLQGSDGDVRADIYAVGVVLYELLCGRLPFEEHDGFALITTHLSHDPPGILVYNPALSPVLATVVMRAIRRDPDKRYASMRDLLHDLCNLEEVVSVDYRHDPPRLGGRYRNIIRLTLIVLVVCLCIVAFGVLAQFAHAGVR